MDDVITLILVHGGAMDMSGVVPQYVGGVEDVIDIHRDVVSYFEITKTLIEDLSYLSVERVWYLTPGEDMATGLHEVHSDVEVMTLLTDAEKGDLRVYFEATKDIGEFGYMGDNYGHGWKVYASWWRKNECFMVKGVGEAHSCPRSLRIRAAGYKWMAKEYLETFRVNQAWDVGLIANEVKRKFNLIVSTSTCYRARLEARRLLYGSLEEDFHQIRDYIGHLIKVDPQGKFLLEVDIEPGEDKVFFKRLYVGFSSLCKGFIAGCRPFFCLDGCFLKGEVQGMLLSAVGKDGNNHMFPIAWAVVESENKSSWIWFVSALQEQLGTLDGKGFTIVSDQQKVFYFCW
ncbi:unnamed protein product [Linum tenue]|uniref:MULE transposase domain-containing protein n=1 Tax=Linum tenue TaxID=586396 RepID=A0AAV0RUB0_9ROSI|nr:unnamed protein product [Linum tenue]